MFCPVRGSGFLFVGAGRCCAAAVSRAGCCLGGSVRESSVVRRSSCSALSLCGRFDLIINV